MPQRLTGSLVSIYSGKQQSGHDLQKEIWGKSGSLSKKFGVQQKHGPRPLFFRLTLTWLFRGLQLDAVSLPAFQLGQP